MSQTLRLLPFASADGATNMAADEAMLESAVLGVASLRFYTWTEPTLSLGYFQPNVVRSRSERERQPLAERADHIQESRRLAERADHTPERDANLSSLAWVRRSTGGAAIVHHHELTYALALPRGKEWVSSENWICRFHHILQRVLKDRGVASHAVVCGEEQKLGEVVCFLHQTPGDLLIDGSKVAGSAQRKMRGALLQHGSILLRRSEFAPLLPGIHDRPGALELTPEELAKLLAAAFATDTGWEVLPGEWTAQELARIPIIRAEKYANKEWNEKR
ncbi:MAG: lipoate--protein ligase family protein [Planctomycetia bacterium]|nr:lipoate--protein ligase family protein [Planctomycetia bacterium]